MLQNNFAKALLSAIDQGLSSLGESPKEAIFFHLESTFQLKKEDIPVNLNEFKQALESIFGPGAPYLERLILKSLHKKLGLDYEESDGADLVVCADDVRKKIRFEREVKIK